MNELKDLYENTYFTQREICDMTETPMYILKSIISMYPSEFRASRNALVRSNGIDITELHYMYAYTYKPTCVIDKEFLKPSGYTKQHMRKYYDRKFRRDRELKVRGWPADNPEWINLYENTELTYEEISDKSGMSMKQLHNRIHEAYTEEYISHRKSRTYSSYGKACKVQRLSKPAGSRVRPSGRGCE